MTIFEDGAPAYFATLPIKAMVQNMRNAGLPASVSNTAGTFVCNHLMYGVLYTLAKSYPGVRGGFMHVPFIPSQVVNRPAAPSMNLQDIAKGIEAAIAAISENENDIAAAEGAIGIVRNANKARKVPLRVILNGLGKDAAQIISRINGFTYVQTDRKSTRLNSSHIPLSRMPSSA